MAENIEKQEKSAADKLAELMVENIGRYNENPKEYDQDEYERSMLLEESDQIDVNNLGGDDDEDSAGKDKPKPPPKGGKPKNPKVKGSKFR